MDNLTRITLSGKEYPMKCDNYVLALIQEKYGSMAEFEMKLVGREPLLDDEGNQKKNENGERMYKKVEPSMEAINFFLPLCINEGLQIEAALLNKACVEIPDKLLIAECDINPFMLALELTKEFYRSMAVKK